MVDLGDLPGGGIARSASGINHYGQVVGIAGSSNHAFLWTPTVANGVTGSMVELGDLPGGIDASSAEDVNSHGQVVGIGHARNGASAFLWTPNTPNGAIGSMVDLATAIHGPDSIAHGINSHGHVVGTSGGQPFLWTPTTPNGTTDVVLNLNSLVEPVSAAGWLLVDARAINDVGQIVGSGDFDPDGPGGVDPVTKAFLLTPIPEPSAMMLAGLGALLLSSNRRRGT
jgi:probable HAF family extracellular repeat protein